MGAALGTPWREAQASGWGSTWSRFSRTGAEDRRWSRASTSRHPCISVFDSRSSSARTTQGRKGPAATWNGSSSTPPYAGRFSTSKGRRRAPRVPAAKAVTRAGALLLALVFVFGGGPAAAQDSLLAISPDAQVGSVQFRFSGSQSFSPAELGSHIALRGRGSLYDLRRLLGELPLVPSPGRRRFDPVELQKDVVRLRLVHHRRAGFFQPAVDYEVRSNDPGTVVDGLRHRRGPRRCWARFWWSARRIRVTRPAGFVDRELEPVRGRPGRAPGQALRRGRSRGGTGQSDRGCATMATLREGGVGAHGRLPSAGGGRAPGGGVRARRPNQGHHRRRERPSATVVLRELLSAPVTAIRPGRWPRHGAAQAVDLLARAVVDVDSQPAADSTLAVHPGPGDKPRLTLAEVGYVSKEPG